MGLLDFDNEKILAERQMPAYRKYEREKSEDELFAELQALGEEASDDYET